LKMQRLNSRSFSKKSQLPQTAPDTLHATGNAFFPTRVPCSTASGTLKAATGAPSGLFNASPLPHCFGVFVWIILLILPILTAVQILRSCTGRGNFSRNPRFRADKTKCGILQG
jgi:hypothetical protein